MVAVILFGFIGCLVAGWLVGISDKDDRVTKFLTYFIAFLMLFLSIICLFSWKQVVQEQVVLEHYNIVQEETTITTYKIIPNGSL